MPLHVGALVIILCVSSLACAVPMLATKFHAFRIPESFFFAVRHFGTGVLLATAFVHLLPTAFISLGNPCLSNFWTADYPAMPGAIALSGIFFVSVIEMVFSPARHMSHCAAPNSTPLDNLGMAHSEGGSNPAESAAQPRESSHGANFPSQLLYVAHSRGERRSSIEPPLQDGRAVRDTIARPYAKNMTEDELQGHALTAEQEHKKRILQCMLLEVGILFHSVFIGMALSVAVGSDFVVLLVAIAFHREIPPPAAEHLHSSWTDMCHLETFEGLALGARIASIAWPKNTWQPWLMVLAYGCT
jgi:solute carrier family 39 (zinc transporter), member 1/2/3